MYADYCKWFRILSVNVTPSPPPRYLSLLTIPSYAGRWSTSGSRRVTHISLPLHKNTIEGTEKIEGQTNKHEQSLGLTKSRGRYATHCIPDSIYGLTLAWVTSENSTMLLESDSSWLTLAGPYPMLPRFSAVQRQLSAVRLSAVQPPTASLLGRVVNSHLQSSANCLSAP